MKRHNPVNINMAWSELVVREFTRLGVGRFFIAPGSRSSPLALAAADFAAAVTVHHDERGLGFAALGWARATGRPAVVITTSGSAAANLWPAVCEAHADGVPMILLTADRPPELRDTGANQTMPQPGLFGNYVRWQMDLPCPDTKVPASYLLGTIDEAFARALGDPAGPVHLNQMFREPLAPVRVRDGASAWQKAVARWWSSDTPWQARVAGRRIPDRNAVDRLAAWSTRRGVIVAGSLIEAEDRAAVCRLGEAWGWPVLPDVRSGLRLDAGASGVISMVDQLLLGGDTAKQLRPACVIHAGGRLSSKRLMAWLAHAQVPYLHLSDTPDRLDPDGVVTERWVASPARAIDALIDASARGKVPAAWKKRWVALHHRLEKAWRELLADPDLLSEPAVAACVSDLIPSGHSLFVASSMPVRDLDMYGLARSLPPEVVANRGVSGIDGNLATACGFALGRGTPVTIVVGDVALLHDLNSLGLIAKAGVPVVVVVINNDGGGIFSFLPVAATPRHFETCFGTPHGRSFRHAAALYDLPYEQPETAAAFREMYHEAVHRGVPCLIEVRTERAANLREHRRIQARLAAVINHA
jgi:2-succinyl-5-enolpyruvyl-6-hydroxy-3-cyclohexene-1-carboxylate synthase